MAAATLTRPPSVTNANSSATAKNELAWREIAFDVNWRSPYQFAQRGDRPMHISRVTLVVVVMILGLWAPTAKASDCGFYMNTNGAAVGRNCASTMQAPPPQRVTAVCRDRTYSFDQGSAACRANGGVRNWMR
jgi:hypothetical protein